MARRGNVKKFQNEDSEIRPIRFRRYQYLFLIVCEDENTEPRYFEHFKNQIPKETIFLKPVGTGRDAKGVVEQAIVERQKLSNEAKKDVDVVWAVFDKDDSDKNAAKINRFEDAFVIAKANNIETAYSNEVFELWFLFHLIDVDNNISLKRIEVYNLLEKNIRRNKNFSTFEYRHRNADIVQIIFEIGNQTKAIKRAEFLMEKQHEQKPINANPSTRVHLLVKELLEWISYYSYKPNKY